MLLRCFAAERKSTFEPLETTFALSYTLRVKRMGFALKRWLHWESSCGKWFRCTSRVQQITDQNLKRSQIISADPWKEDRFGLGWPRWSPSIAAVSLSLMLECDNWSRQKKGRPIPDWIQCCTVGYCSILGHYKCCMRIWPVKAVKAGRSRSVTPRGVFFPVRLSPALYMHHNGTNPLHS